MEDERAGESTADEASLLLRRSALFDVVRWKVGDLLKEVRRKSGDAFGADEACVEVEDKDNGDDSEGRSSGDGRVESGNGQSCC